MTCSKSLHFSVFMSITFAFYQNYIYYFSILSILLLSYHKSKKKVRRDFFMKQRNAEILLIIVIASRSISYLLSKIGLNGIPPLELLAIRFALTTLILLLLFHRRLPLLTRQLWKAAGLLGTFLFACMACELISLTTIPSSTAAFLENTSAVWVLILMAVVSHHWPGKQVLTATGLLLIGIACLTLQGAVFHLAPGEIICLTGSVFYALWICLTARLARQYDPLLLGILQMGFLAVYSTVGMVLFESPAVPADTTTWGAIMALVFICSVFGFTFQPVAQKYTSAEKAGLFTALNPLIAAVLGVIFLGEIFTPVQLAGAICILLGIIIVQLPEKYRCKTHSCQNE